MFRRKLKTELFVVWFDCCRARLCDDLSLIVRFEMSGIIIIIVSKRWWGMFSAQVAELIV